MPECSGCPASESRAERSSSRKARLSETGNPDAPASEGLIE